MAHRVSLITGRKEPKKKASERTWFRFRMRKDIPSQDDNLRLTRREEVSNRLKEMFGMGKKIELANM